MLIKNKTKAGQENINKVVVVDFDMSFGSMVNFMVKLALAAIPVAIILGIVGFLAYALLAGIFS